MKHILFFSLPLLLLIIGCSENETGPITYTDAELKEKLVGTWENNYTTVVFEGNGNYTQNIYIAYIMGDTVDPQIEVVKGTFNIENGVLNRNITEWNIVNQSQLQGSSGMNLTAEVIFVRNTLYLNNFNKLVRIGDNPDSIWGEWYTTELVHDYFEPEEFGLLEHTYYFNKDSMSVRIGSRSYTQQDYSYNTYLLTYNPPEISWENHIPRLIEFYNNQIKMFYKHTNLPKPLVRQN